MVEATSRPVDLLLGRLEGVRRSGGGWTARCPAHDDRHSSLSVDEGADGCALIHCHVGCTATAITTAVGLRLADLFPRAASNGHPRRGGGGSPSPRKRVEHSNGPDAGLTLERYAAAKQLPVDFLRGHGLSNLHYLGVPAVRMVYPKADGSAGPTRFRLRLERTDSRDDRFRWKKGDKPCLYGLDRLERARSAGYVVLVEGESDCQTGWLHDLPVLGVPGATSWKDERDAPHLAGIERVYVVVEPDAGGEALRGDLGRSSARERLRLVDLGEDKDLSGLYLADPAGFVAALERALAASVAWVDLADRERARAVEEQRELAGDLLVAPDLLDRLRRLVTARGYAGDPAPVLRVYVAITSRLLERPVNVAVVSDAAAGKNATVNAGRELMPAEAIHYEGAGSARALVYTDADFAHKAVIVEEADSIPDDGPGAQAVRAIAENNEMVYDVVERDEQTHRFAVRRIVKPGPTCLITTSTRSVKHQLGTRMLEMGVPDDEVQTRAVMRAHARAARKGGRPVVDVAPWIALQRYIALSGVTDVDVPFGEALVGLIPARAVRMRRDSRQLLAFVKAIALLHQDQREDLGDGWIRATFADYDAARALLGPMFDAVVAEGCTPAIRATVAAVKPGEELSAAALGLRLGLSRSTVSWRVEKAIAGGWLVNNEAQKGRPARLALGAPLPEDESALPTVDRLREAVLFECSSGFGDGDDPPPPSPDGDEAEQAPDWTEGYLAERDDEEVPW
jgi:hypothetical protein